MRNAVKRTEHRLARIVEWIVIACALTVVFLTNIDRVNFHADESQWINSSQYFELAMSGHIHAPAWQPDYVTITQPPIARYVIGLGRLAGGHGVSDLNGMWRFEISPEMNAAERRMPSPSLLWWSRLPMAIAAVLSGLLLVYCAHTLGGRLAGYVLLLLLATTPYYAEHLRRAMGESLLLLQMMLVVLAAYGAVRSWQAVMGQSDRAAPRGGMVLARPLAWLAVLAVLGGLAGATKLNGLALVGAGIALCAMLAWKSRTRLPGRQVAMFAAAGLILMPALTGAAFVGVNPYLYPNPARRFDLMVQHRNEAIRDQQAVYPTDAIPTGDIVRRVRMVPVGILRNVSPVAHGVMWVVMAALTLVGLAVLARQALQWWRDDQQSGMGIAILLVAGVMVGPALLTPLDWDRYYLPPVVLASLCTALSVPAGVAWFRARR